MTRPYTRIAVVALAVGLALSALALRFGPTLVVSAALALPSQERWLTRLASPPVRDEITVPAGGHELDADLYRPARARSALLLVHGLSRAGRRHPELERLARLLGQQGQLVLVPTFEGLAAFQLSGREVDEIQSALRYLAGLSDAVGIAGFSFGAGPALLAAAGTTDLRVVASFGGYADLENVIAFITTGTFTFDGRHYARHSEQYNRWKLLTLLAGFVESNRDRTLLEAIAERKLADPSRATTALERGLGDEGHRVLAVVLNHREDALGRLLAGLPRRAREAFRRLSPLAAASRLRGRLLIAHGAADDSIPFTESLRLAEAAGGRGRVAIFRTFHHTGPKRSWSSLRDRALDAWHLVRLADDLLFD